MRTPAELIEEAEEAEATAKIVSYAKDREWLLAKAEELRRLASRGREAKPSRRVSQFSASRNSVK